MALVFTMCAYIGRTNRRLEALLELMELDRAEQASRPPVA
jgi:hypothetical protein